MTAAEREVRQQVVIIITEHASVGTTTGGPETRLDDLGLDSLDRVSIAVVIDTVLGVKISDTQLATAQTVEDLIQAVLSPQ